jgi:crossover junction endodeoxyribonuclease RuvC
MIRLLGLDPGSRRLGWGLIEVEGSRLVHVEHGTLIADHTEPLSERLGRLSGELEAVIARTQPRAAAVEKVFTARNVHAALTLGQARGVVLAVLGRAAIPVSEYAPAEVKLAVTGHGRASKDQVAHMVARLLGVDLHGAGPDSTDALAIAICHAHGRRRDAIIARATGEG